jgi:hypothetical protein
MERELQSLLAEAAGVELLPPRSLMVTRWLPASYNRQSACKDGDNTPAATKSVILDPSAALTELVRAPAFVLLANVSIAS